MVLDWFNAIRAGDTAFVRLNASKYRGARNKHNETGLIYAIKHNRVDIASLLIPYERNLVLDGGFTPLMVCALYNSVNIASLLGASGHSAVNSEMQTALMIAAERDHAQIIRIILPNEVMRKDSRDRTALMLSSISGQNKAAEILLPHEGGFVNSHGETAFYLALYHNNITTAKLLEPVEANTWCEKLASVVGMCLSDPKTAEYIQYLAHKYPNMEKAYTAFHGQAGAVRKGAYMNSVTDFRQQKPRRAGVLSPLETRMNKTILISPVPGKSVTPRLSKSVNSRIKHNSNEVYQSIKSSGEAIERFKDAYINDLRQIRQDVADLKNELETRESEPPRASTSIPRTQKTPTILHQPAATPTLLPMKVTKDGAVVTHSFTSSPPRIRQPRNDVSALCNEIIVSFTKTFGTKRPPSTSLRKHTHDHSTQPSEDEAKSTNSSMFERVEQGMTMTESMGSVPSTRLTSADAYINHTKQMQYKLLSMFNQRRHRSPDWAMADSSLLSNPSTQFDDTEAYNYSGGPMDNLEIASIPRSLHNSQQRTFEIVYDQVVDNETAVDSGDTGVLNMRSPHRIHSKPHHIPLTAAENAHEPIYNSTRAPNPLTGSADSANTLQSSVVQQTPQETRESMTPNNPDNGDANRHLMDTIENFTQIIDDLSNENIMLNKELDKFKRAQRQMNDVSKADKQTIETLKKQLDSMMRNFSEATMRDIHTMKKEISRLDHSLMDAKRLEFELSRVIDDEDTERVTGDSLVL